MDDAKYQLLRLTLAMHSVPLPVNQVSLGSGAYASVYATEDDRVVKVTGDMRERYAAELVRRQVAQGTPHPNVVRVDHVWAWGTKTITVNERLVPLTDAEGNNYSRCPFNNIVDVLHLESHDPRLMNVRVVEGQLLEIAQGLRAAGINSWTDCHRWNVMKRARPEGGWHYVISDLGMTNSPNVEPPALGEVGDLDGDVDDGEDKRRAAVDLKVRQAREELKKRDEEALTRFGRGPWWREKEVPATWANQGDMYRVVDVNFQQGRMRFERVRDVEAEIRKRVDAEVKRELEAPPPPRYEPMPASYYGPGHPAMQQMPRADKPRRADPMAYYGTDEQMWRLMRDEAQARWAQVMTGIPIAKLEADMMRPWRDPVLEKARAGGGNKPAPPPAAHEPAPLAPVSQCVDQNAPCQGPPDEDWDIPF